MEIKTGWEDDEVSEGETKSEGVEESGTKTNKNIKMMPAKGLPQTWKIAPLPATYIELNGDIYAGRKFSAELKTSGNLSPELISVS